MSAKFLIYPSDRYFGFTFTSASGNTIVSSRLFRSLALCRQGIETMRKVVGCNELLEKREKPEGQYSFVVRDEKGMLLAHSPVYWAAGPRNVALRQLTTEIDNAAIQIEKAQPESRSALN